MSNRRSESSDSTNLLFDHDVGGWPHGESRALPLIGVIGGGGGLKWQVGSPIGRCLLELECSGPLGPAWWLVEQLHKEVTLGFEGLLGGSGPQWGPRSIWSH